MKKLIIGLILLTGCTSKIDYRCNCNEPTQSGNTVYSYMIWKATLNDAKQECTANQYCVLQDV